MIPSQEPPPYRPIKIRGPSIIGIICALMILLTLFPISTNEEINSCNDSIYCGKKIKIYKHIFYIVFRVVK